MCQPSDPNPSPAALPAKPDKGYRSISIRGLTKAQLSRLKERARNIDMSMEAYVRMLITEDDVNHALVELAEQVARERPDIAKRIMQIVEGDDGKEKVQEGT